MKNVIMISNRYFPMIGGAEAQCRALSKALSSLDVNIECILTHRYSDALLKREEIDNILVYRLGFPGENKISILSFYFSLFIFLVKFRKTYDIVHSHSISFTSIIAVITSFFLNKKSLIKWTVAGEIESFYSCGGLKGVLKRILISFTIKKSHVAVLTKEGVNEINRYKNHGYTKINNGVDQAVFNSNEKKPRDLINKKTLTIGFVGRLIKSKGINDVSNVIERLSDCTKFSFELMGADDYQAESAMSILNELKRKDLKNFNIIRPVNPPVDFYNKIDVYLSMSKKEGMPNTVLEALSCGRFCILSRIPAHEEIYALLGTEAEKRIFLVDSVDDVVNLLLSPDFNSIISNDKLSIPEVFDIKTVAKRYLNLYREL